MNLKNLNSKEKKKLAIDSNTSADVLDKLVDIGSPHVQNQVEKNPNTSSKTHLKIQQKRGVRRRIHQSKNSNTSKEVLAELAQDDNEIVRKNIASNPNTPIKALENLINDDSWLVKRKVLFNPNINTEIFKNLVGFIEKYLNSITDKEKIILADNLHTSKGILKKLAYNDCVDIRKRVASNPNTPANVIYKLAKDKKYSVRESVYQNSNSNYCCEKIRIVKNSNSSGDVLKELAKDDDIFIRWEVIFHPNTPKKIIENLIKNVCSDEDFYLIQDERPEWFDEVIEKIVDENCPAEILAGFGKHCDSHMIKELVASNPQIPIELLKKLFDYEDSFYGNFNGAIASNPNTPPEILSELAEDDDPCVRISVARNPNTPAEVLRDMVRDIVDQVRQSVLKNDNFSRYL